MVQRILADDFIGVDPKGRQYNKSSMISDTWNAPKYFVSNRFNDVKEGSTAIRRLHKERNPGNDTAASADDLFGPTLGFGEMAAGKSWQLRT